MDPIEISEKREYVKTCPQNGIFIWNILMWYWLFWCRYGGGPALARKVIARGSSQTELTVEVYPLRLQLHLLPRVDQCAVRMSRRVQICSLYENRWIWKNERVVKMGLGQNMWFSNTDQNGVRFGWIDPPTFCCPFFWIS